MKLAYNVTGNTRKKMVTAIKHHLATESNYLGAPTFAYEIGEYTVSQNGTITGPDNHDLEIALREKGFNADTAAEPSAFEELPLTEREELGLGRELRDHPGENGPHPSDVPDPEYLTIEMPLTGFTSESLDNLCKLVASKEVLLKKAIGADELPIQVLEDRIAFPWFSVDTDSETIAAYSQFITALCKTAREKKRVTAKAQESFENEKFAMRVWLIGLGLVGKEYGAARKLLMANLGGNSGFRYGTPDGTAPAKVRIAAPLPNETAEQRAKRELAQRWGNNGKRREFLHSYSEWGVWITVPELGLTYYKYELPDSSRLLAMEYQRENSYPFYGEDGVKTLTTYFLWDGEYFSPNAASERTIIERLKTIGIIP